MKANPIALRAAVALALARPCPPAPEQLCAVLESTHKRVSRIAEQRGLGTEADLPHHFRRVVGVTPTQYRRTFRR